jgi:hypothetical protein
VADQEPTQQESSTPAKSGGLPYGVLLGVALGAATGFALEDLAIGMGLAVAFGITFSFLSPLVRESLSKKTPEDAAADHSGASSEEHDDK